MHGCSGVLNEETKAQAARMQHQLACHTVLNKALYGTLMHWNAPLCEELLNSMVLIQGCCQWTRRDGVEGHTVNKQKSREGGAAYGDREGSAPALA